MNARHGYERHGNARHVAIAIAALLGGAAFAAPAFGQPEKLGEWVSVANCATARGTKYADFQRCLVLAALLHGVRHRCMPAVAKGCH